MLEQVGVKAPGKEKTMTFFPLNKSSVVTSFQSKGFSAVLSMRVLVLKVTSGTRSPSFLGVTQAASNVVAYGNPGILLVNLVDENGVIWTLEKEGRRERLMEDNRLRTRDRIAHSTKRSTKVRAFIFLETNCCDSSLTGTMLTVVVLCFFRFRTGE